MIPRISIITVVRNAPEDLEKTLENLTSLDTSVAELELIVIDGASTDRTPGVIRRYEERIAYWVSEPDAGLYDAMNKGMDVATGDYLWFVNAGDTVRGKDALTRIFEGETEWADIYYGETLVASETGEILGLRKKKLPENLTWKSLKRGMVVCHQSFIVRREIAPLYDTARYRLAADIEWVIECLKRAHTIRYTGSVLSCFTEGGISTQRRRESLRERWRIMVRHYGYWSTLWAHVRFLFSRFGPSYRQNRTGC